MSLILLVIACNAVPLLFALTFSKIGPWLLIGLVGLCAWAFVTWVALVIFRALARINSNNKLT